MGRPKKRQAESPWTFDPPERTTLCSPCLTGRHYNRCDRPNSCRCACNSIELRAQYRDAIRKASTVVSSAGVHVLKARAMAAAVGRAVAIAVVTMSIVWGTAFAKTTTKPVVATPQTDGVMQRAAELCGSTFGKTFKLTPQECINLARYEVGHRRPKKAATAAVAMAGRK